MSGPLCRRRVFGWVFRSCVILCVLYFLLLNMISARFMFVELYYRRVKSWSNLPHCKYIYIVFSYIYSCSLLNIVILKPSRWFVHLHCPDLFYHIEQGQEEGGAIRGVALGVVVLFSYNNNIYLLQLGCHPVAVVILHVNKTWNWLLLNLSREGYMRCM